MDRHRYRALKRAVMKTLWHIEWMKIRRYRTFWVFLSLFVLVMGGTNWIVYRLEGQVHISSGGQLRMHLFDYPAIWSTTAWCGGFSVLLLGLLLVILVTNEWAFRTHRQQVIDGMGRTRFMGSQWLMAAVLAVFAWLLYVGITLLIGGLGSDALAWEGLRYALYFLVRTVLILSLALVLALWLKRAGLAIALYLVYVLLGEAILRFIINLWTDGWGVYLPLSAAGHLISNPLAHLIPEYGRVLPAYGMVALCLGYAVLFVALSLGHIRRADL